MGGALLRRWLAADIGPVAVIDPAPAALPEGIVAAADPPAGVPDILVLAVKPQVWRAVAPPLAGRVGPFTVIVSVMAGVSTADLAVCFERSPIVRAMPNTPAAVGQGITALYTGAGDLVKGAATALFGPAGATLWLDREDQFDAVTAVSGSGPAYVYAFVEALAAAGAAAGLSPDIAGQLARQTVTGAAALAAAEPMTPVATLRERVTSPGGTTAAGLAVLRPALDPLVEATVAAAAARARALG